jgi:hypothetical protein
MSSTPSSATPVRLSVESLESRELPSSTPWQLETFETQTPRIEPTGWSQWSSSPSARFQVGIGEGFASDKGIASNATASNVTSRAWMSTPFDADVQVRASIHVENLVPGQLFVRGQNLNTSTPNYYALTVTRGMEVQLVKVLNGQSSVLSTVRSSTWFGGQWIQATLIARGDRLQVQIFRADTAQYLSEDGTWQATPTNVVDLKDSSLIRGGMVGFGRAANAAGKVGFDNFQITTKMPQEDVIPLHSQNFAGTKSGTLPAGWKQWSDDRSNPITVDRGPVTLTDSPTLTIRGGTTKLARAWLDSTLPADVQATAALYLENTIPAQIFIRGKDLDTTRPDYYAVSIRRGTQIQLIRVLDGQSTVLSTVDSKTWLSQQWVQVSISATGSTLRVQLFRTDTAQYLSSDGNWQVTPTWAIERQDASIAGAGRVGVARAGSYAGSLIFDNFFVTTSSHGTTSSSTQKETFDQTPVNRLPTNWKQWSNQPDSSFSVSTLRAISGKNGIVSNGPSTATSRVWMSDKTLTNVEVRGAIYTDSLVPGELFIRGQNLDTERASYYSVRVSRGLNVQLVRVNNGQETVLGSLTSREYLSNQWIRVTLRAVGDNLQVEVQRTDTGEYLAPDRTWVSYPVVSIQATERTITKAGYVGLGRSESHSGRIVFDDIVVSKLEDSPASPPPTPTPTPTPPPSIPPSKPAPIVTPPVNSNLPTVPRHYNHIRVAQLAYIGTPISSSLEQKLLRESIDLIVPNTAYLDQINQTTPNTPQMIYTNVSNIYENLLTDWLAYADRKGLSRESAFYHVTEASPFSGDSASSRPVNWFWSVARGNDSKGWTDLTFAARKAAENLTFGANGEVLAVGYPERFREINVTLSRAGASTWNSVIEYPTAVDANGKPTRWASLPLLRDGTSGLRTNGTILFDPPKNWVAASVNGGARLFYVRFRTTGTGAAPIVMDLMGRDYVNAAGRTTGIIPAFDNTADKDGDGYLNDKEYATRKRGMDARFVYESRLFFPAYGQQRFATNVTNNAFREWAVDYHIRVLNSQPKADGFFVDNSIGRLQIDDIVPKETIAAYSEDYGSLLSQIQNRLGGKWLLANTAGGGASVDSLIRNGISYIEEFALRPLSHNHVHFEDIAAMVQKRLQLANGKGYAILDTFPQGGSPTDPRTQIAQLSYYYLLADPKTTMIMFNGGFEPATSWSRHWTDAVKYNVGQPKATWSQLATGVDPANRNLTYKVYQREYTNALVLYKPLSYAKNVTGTTANNTATVHKLNGNYRALQANGTLGSIINQISLRNGEGAILVKA